MGSLDKIETILTKDVGNFNIITAAVAYRTFKVESKCAKSALQALTYISRPLDLLIQVVSSPVFAAYQTARAAKSAFEVHPIIGLASLTGSPLIFAIAILKNLLSTKFIMTPLNLAIPMDPIYSMIYPENMSNSIIFQMYKKYPFMFEDLIQEKKDAIITGLQADPIAKLLKKYFIWIFRMNSSEYDNHIKKQFTADPKVESLLNRLWLPNRIRAAG